MFQTNDKENEDNVVTVVFMDFITVSGHFNYCSFNYKKGKLMQNKFFDKTTTVVNAFEGNSTFPCYVIFFYSYFTLVRILANDDNGNGGSNGSAATNNTLIRCRQQQ
jgi:hypothetical protein